MRRLFTLTILLSIAQGHAYIYEVKILKAIEPQDNHPQYVIFFSDFHDKKSAVNAEQIKKINYCLKRCHPFFVAVLTEDLSSQTRGNNGNICGCGKYVLDSRGGILGGLTTQCAAYGLPVENLEYRYCRVVALGPVATNSEDDKNLGITVQQLVQEIKNIIDEIKAYNDGAALNAVYKNIVTQVEHDAHLLKLPAYMHMNVHDFLTHYVPFAEDRAVALKNLLTFDSTLLDLRIAHAIVTNKEAHNVLVFVGGSHADRVCEILKNNRYQELSATGAYWYREYDTRKCTGIARVQEFCSMPRPVKKHYLDDVLDKIRLNTYF